MTDTANLGLPFIEGSQAQKHVTHNDALRILDAAIQIAVLDRTLTTPPALPDDGDRHIVAIGASGHWSGRDDAIATWQDGVWVFLAPKAGWCVWSVADSAMFVYDGTAWREQAASFDDVDRLGINTVATAPNLLSVRSNAALLTSIDAADGGTGDMRVQVSRESSANTASVVFSNNYSGRAEFGLVGSDAFKLKVSADGSSFIEAFVVDQGSGNLTLRRGLTLSGVIAPSQITANQNDYAPAGFAGASVVQLSTDAARTLSGLAGGDEGRVVCLLNVGSQTLTLLDDNAASSAANRFALGGNLVVAGKQAVLLRYDGTAARWQALSRPWPDGLLAANNLSDLVNTATARNNLGVRDVLAANRTYYVRVDGSDSNTGLVDSAGGAFLTIQKAIDAVAALDMSIFQATIQVRNGTFTATVALKPYVGALPPIIQGNSATPANVLLNTSTACIINDAGGVWKVRDLKLQSGDGGLYVKNGGDIRFQNIDFGACAYHIRADAHSRVVATGSCTISGAATYHAFSNGGLISYSGGGFTFALSGSQTYSIFAIATNTGFIEAGFTTFSGGTISGIRYVSQRNSVIDTNGGGANYFPGNVAGSTGLGGVYI